MLARHAIIGVVFALLAPLRLPAQATVMELSQGWQFRLGDSPVDSAGTPLWAYDSLSNARWKELSSLNTPANRQSERFVWYRIRLPEQRCLNPTLFLPPTLNACEVYLGKEMIYRFGDFKPSKTSKYAAITSHLIALPENFGGRQLALRIYSESPHAIGVYDLYLKVAIGPEGAILKRIFLRNIDGFVLGFLLIFFGLAGIFVFLRRFKQRMFFPVAFGAFAVCMGAFYASIYPISMIFLEDVVFRYFVGHLAFSLFPVGLYVFFDHIIGSNKLVRTLWLLHLAYAAAALILDLLGVIPMAINQNMYYTIFLIVSISIVFFLGIKSAFHGNIEARIFVAGFSIFVISGLYDLLVNLGLFPFWRGLSQWGALTFILFLGYIVERRFSQTHERVQQYSKELELKSEQLQEYSQQLEAKVAERTQNLNQKNVELERALIELRETQEQLILKEKMASLGNLVAGVAHEVNNPIGAIHSAADVTSRCIAKLRSLVGSDGQSKPDELRRAFQLLEENSRVTSAATERVSRIVKSLKNFARLDEAEYQESHIHEGLDSTLTMLQHELKGRIEIVKNYGDIPAVSGFPNQLNQVFMNLLVNAIQAIDEKGTITITTSRENDRVIVEIRDTGAGITPDKIEKIFDPGFTTKGVGVGTGLGLSISHNIIKKHKGTLSVDSAVGEGTTFTIALPVTT